MCFEVGRVDVERAEDATDDGRTLCTANGTVVVVTVGCQRATDAEVLYSSVLHETEEAVEVVFSCENKVREGVSLTIEHASERIVFAADRLEVRDVAHVNVVHHNALQVVSAIVDENREEHDVRRCCQLIATVDGLNHELAVVHLFCKSQSFFCRDVAIREVIQRVLSQFIPVIEILFGNHFDCVEGADAVGQRVGCVEHCNVCLAAGVNFVEELGEGVDECYLVLRIVIGILNCLLEFGFQLIRNVGLFAILVGVVNVVGLFEVHDDLSASFVTLEHLIKSVACFVSVAEIDEVEVAEGHPVIAET